MAKKKTYLQQMLDDKYNSTGGSSLGSTAVDVIENRTNPARTDKTYAQSQADRDRATLLVNDISDPTEDTRNPIEKFLNLDEGQNFIFDIFELLGRPQQALFGAIDELQTGGNALEGAWQGLSGEKDTSGGQLLRNMGIGNGDNDVNLLDPSSWGTDDVLGLVLDIFADPADLLVFPAVGKVANTVMDASDALRLANKGKLSLNDLAFGTAKNLGKKAVGATDNIVGNALKKIDASHGFNYTGDVLTDISENLAKTGTINSKVPLFQMYTGAKDEISNAFNQGKKLINQRIRGRMNQSNSLSSEGSEIARSIAKNAENELRNQLPELQRIVRDSGQSLNVDESLLKGLLNPNTDTALNSWRKYIDQMLESDTQSAIDRELLARILRQDVNTSISDVIGLGYKSSNSIIPNTTQRRNFLNTVSDELSADKFGRIVSEQQYQNLKKIKDAQGTLKTADRMVEEWYRSSLMLPSGTKVDINDAWKALDEKMTELASNIANYSDYASVNSAIQDALSRSSKNMIPLSEENMKGLNDAYRYLRKKGKLGDYDYKSLLSEGTLSESAPSRQLFNTLRENEAIQKYASAPERINKELDGIMDRMGWQFDDQKHKNTVPRTVENTIGDFTGRDKNMQIMDAYKAYHPTYVTDEMLTLLKGIPEDEVRPLFTNRSIRIMDTTSINEYFKQLTDSEIQSLFPRFKKEQIDKFKEIVSTKGFYRNNVSDNILDMAENLPKQLSKTGLKNDIINGIGYQDIQNQKKIQSRIKENRETLAKMTGENYNKGGYDLVKAKIDSDIQLLDKIQKKSMFKPASDLPFSNTGFKVVSYSDIESAINGISKTSKTTYKEVLDDLKKMSQVNGNNKLAVNPLVYNLLNLNRDPNKTTSAIFGMLDRVNNAFKRNKLLSPAYNVRNITGNATNLYLAGIPAKDVPGLLIDATKDYDNAVKAITSLNEGKLLKDLPKEQREAYAMFNKLRSYGFGEVLKDAEDVAKSTASKLQGMDTVEDITKTIKGKGTASKILKKGANLYDNINKANLNLNVLGDNISRIAMYKYASAHPQYLKRMGFSNAGQAVANALFDPSDLSDFEKSVMRKIMPFYTFTKKNLAFQMRNLFDNPKQYKRFIRLIDAMWGNTPEEERSDYWEEGFALPISQNADGTQTLLNLNLPAGDLVEYTQNPLNSVVSSLSPLLRAPFELSTNTNTFTGRPISEFKGQESEIINNLPFLQENGLINALPSQVDNRYFDYLFGNFTGLDQPLSAVTDLSNVAGATFDALNGQGSTNDILNSLGNFAGFISTNNPQSALTSRDYQQMEQLNDYMDFLEQEGYNLVSVTDWEDTNQGKINARLQAELDALMGRKHAGQREVTVGDTTFYIPSSEY